MLSRLLLLSALSSISWIAFAQSLPASGTGDDSRRYLVVREGSTTTHRGNVDSYFGQVFIYRGGAFPVGTYLVSFHFLFDESSVGNTSGYITPLLLDQTSPGIYTVIAIGRGYEVVQSLLPQSIPLVIVNGVIVPRCTSCTFGYINALVDSDGIPTVTSPGTVDFDYGDPGNGLGGPLTSNGWAATGLPGSETPVVTLGTTFGAAGATYPFYPQLRTYSAFISGIVAR